MNKPFLFLDFDDTLVNTEILFRRWIVETFGVEAPAGYINHNELPEIINSLIPGIQKIDPNAFYRKMNEEFLHNDFWCSQLVPLSGADAVLPKLAEKYNLQIVTARPTTSFEVVNKILNRLFPNCISSVSFVWRLDENGVYQKINDKHEIVSLKNGQRAGFVDDSPSEVMKFINREVEQVILFDPQERHNSVFPSPIKKIKSWKEIEDLFLKL